MHRMGMSSDDIKTDTEHHVSTADYRKYPKGPNFKLIVVLACVALLVILFGSWLILRMNPRMVPDAHGPRPAQGSTHASPQ